MTINQYFTKGRFLLEAEISVKRNFAETPKMKLTSNAKHTRLLPRVCRWKFNPFFAVM